MTSQDGWCEITATQGLRIQGRNFTTISATKRSPCHVSEDQCVF
jgi:hypothetical protein